MNVQDTVKKFKFPIAGGIAAGMLWLNSLSEEKSALPAPEQAIVEQAVKVPVAEQRQPEKAVPAEIAVDIKGAVATPGIYRMLNSERVNEAIEKAGGPTKQANMQAINLAQKVQDEMVIYVPEIGEDAPPEIPSSSTAATSANDASSSSESEKPFININDADLSKLQELPGIGESKAQAIIDYRQTDGPFSSLEQLKSVPGIGDKIYEKLAPLITLH